jgi:hypothetical protein
MRDDRAEIRREEPMERRCANEGCGRPSEGRYCDACALEWSLFHREERGPVRPAGRRFD